LKIDFPVARQHADGLPRLVVDLDALARHSLRFLFIDCKP
jgi:hypothetical protein